LATNGYGIGGGSSLVFTAIVPTASTVNAAFEIKFTNSSTATIDPAIPNTAAIVPVPEPSSMLALGSAMVGLLAVGRRKA
jgi:hypothetical protein